MQGLVHVPVKFGPGVLKPLLPQSLELDLLEEREGGVVRAAPTAISPTRVVSKRRGVAGTLKVARAMEPFGSPFVKRYRRKAH